MLSVKSAVVSAVLYASLARAGGSIDNSAEAQQVVDSGATLSGAGQYVIENVATGQVLSFLREGGTTNFYPNDNGRTVDVQFDGTAARLSGENNKCTSAQWSYDVEGGVDHAAVSYACAVGQGEKTGTDSLEKTKQWWYFVPVAGSSDNNNDNGNNDNGNDNSQSDVADSPRVMMAVKTQKSSDNNNNNNNDNSGSDNSGLLSHDKGYYEYADSTIPLDKVDQSGVNSKDRSSWICRHPGWWLNNHPAYVDAGHPECASDLAAYRAANKRLVKRGKSSHHELARKLSKRDGQRFYIIAQDHLWVSADDHDGALEAECNFWQDMATRAIGSQAVSTYGGYQSTILSLWDKSDESQMWTISSA